MKNSLPRSFSFSCSEEYVRGSQSLFIGVWLSKWATMASLATHSRWGS